MTSFAQTAPTVGGPPEPGTSRRRAAVAWNLGATVVIWGTSLMIGVLWVSGGGITDLLAMDGDTLTTLGRLTGLISANLLLYQVLLMARVPLFERGFGRGGMVRMHRFVGLWSFWLLMAHFAFVVAGYAVAAQVNPFVQLWEFVWDYPGMLLATAGTGLLILVVVTSARRSRRRLRYESWHLLHLYGYLGVGLAIPHMLWTGADFQNSTPATVYWWALWAVAAACVLVFRVALPLVRSVRHDVRVVEVIPDGNRSVTVRMRGRGLHRLGTRSGQFFVWRFLDGPGWSRGHPLSLAAAPAGNELVVSARLVGDGTERLASVRPGTRVMIEGPLGHLTGERRIRSTLLMLGAGTGIAPLVALLESEPYAPGDAVLVTRDHEPAERVRNDEIGTLVAQRGLVHYALDGSRSRQGSSWLPARFEAWAGPDLLRELAPDLEERDVYVCGPAGWMESVVADLRVAGVPASRIHTEAFTM